MSSQLKVSQSTYSRIEKGNVNITMSRLNQIANILKVEVTDIINFNETVVLKIFKKESNLST
jgi:transcriptional regulator with XRE-family HTH domain